MRVEWHLNAFDGMLGADAFGVVVTLFALCHMAEQSGDDVLIERYHLLRAFAVEHAESRMILRAID